MLPRLIKETTEELEREGIEPTCFNINGCVGTGIDFDDVREQIIDWLELTGAEPEEIEAVENEKDFEFKYSEDFYTWYMKFGERYIVFENSSELSRPYNEKGIGDRFLSDYIFVDGEREIFLVNNNALEL